MNGSLKKTPLGFLASALFLILFLIVSSDAYAQRGRKPCSGKKGGISHCQGTKYVCKDGSISASKKSCNRYSKDKT